MNEDIDRNAKILWDYMLLHQELRPMDAIFALGSNDTRVAERSAELYLEGYAPLIIFSGKWGKSPSLEKTEAEAFTEVALAKGVPREVILQEDEATNTGENILFTKRLLEQKGLSIRRFILVQKPYMERRTYATMRKQWPEAECVVTSPQIPYDEYASEAHHADKERFLNVLTGDLWRIKEYPVQGFQIPQDIPEDVWTAYERLLDLGYTKFIPAA